MKLESIMFCISSAFILVGGIFLVYQLYHIVLMDAKARGLKHPRFWGFFALGNNNGGGLLLYLIGRRNHPVIMMTNDDRQMLSKRKTAAGAGLAFISLGAIGFIISTMLL